MWARPMPSCVHQPEHDLGVPAGVVGAAGRLAGGAETGQVGRVHAVALAERGRGLEQRRARAAEAVQQQHVGTVAHRQRGDRGGGRPERRGSAAAAAGRPGSRNIPSKRDRVVEVAAHGQQPALEGLDAGELALAQRQPGVGVGGDGHVGLRAGWRPCAPGRRGGAAHLPGVAEVAEPDVIRGVESRVAPEVALRQRCERPASTARQPGRHERTALALAGDPTGRARPDRQLGGR